ncbi:hypothetical protein ASG21_18050 [Chryseobacterium sp. Leaf394]|nr:hypothetical protein ASG21_18050 [Chryseobacterium sp. Leaf394]
MDILVKNLRITAITALSLFLIFKFFVTNSNLEHISGIAALSCFAALLAIFGSKLISRYYIK